MVDHEKIEQGILSANIESICNPHTGDCVSVAVAIKEVFGGEYLCSYQHPSDRRPAHAAVEIDGVPYDGSGATSIGAMYDVATSGLKSDERYTDEEHIGRVSKLTNNALYDETVKEKVKESIENSL